MKVARHVLFLVKFCFWTTVDMSMMICYTCFVVSKRKICPIHIDMFQL